MLSLKAVLAIPTAAAPTDIRMRSRVRMANLNPSPKGPRRFSFGTLSPSISNSTISWLAISSIRQDTFHPGMVRSTIKAERRVWSFSTRVFAKSTPTLAEYPLEMNRFRPLITKKFP